MPDIETPDLPPAVDPAPAPAPAEPVGSAPEAEAPAIAPTAATVLPGDPAEVHAAEVEETDDGADDAGSEDDAENDVEADPVPEGFLALEHDDRTASATVSGVAYAADEFGRFLVRLEHVAALLAHGFRPPPVAPDEAEAAA